MGSDPLFAVPVPIDGRYAIGHFEHLSFCAAGEDVLAKVATEGFHHGHGANFAGAANGTRICVLFGVEVTGGFCFEGLH
jgi:hypothetical protein